MNAQVRSIKFILVLALLIAMIAPLVGCAPAALGAVEIGIEPTATPRTLSYNNEAYGFRFEYPTTWSLVQEDHRVTLAQGSLRLGINYRWSTENIPPDFGRTGMAAGTPIYRGKVTFLGKALPINVFELDHLRKYVIYGDSNEVQVDNLTFMIVLEDLGTDYTTQNLPESAIRDAKAVLESFDPIPATGSPPAEKAATPTIGGSPGKTEVVARLGHIASLPAGSQYDDMLVLSPSGTGEFGLTGATSEIEAEIQSLRDAEGPNEFVFVWGFLACGGVNDYNGCQLSVDRLQYGAKFSEQAISDWIGKITTSTFNGGLSYVFVLDSEFPMWYGIWASQDPALQAQIEHYQETGEVVEISGKLMVGVPDVNGTRIEINRIEPRSMAGPRLDSADEKQYQNPDFGFSFSYPSAMSVEEQPHRVVVTRDALQMTIAYRRADESVSIVDGGPPQGQLVPYTEVYFLDQFVEPALDVKDGYIWGVYLGGPGTELGEGTPLRFVIRLINTHGEQLSNGQVDEMLSLFQTLRLVQ